MTDTPPQDDSGAEQQPGFNILAQYVRDLSFENPLAPESLRATGGQPAIDIGVELNARRRPDDLYEIDLKLTVKAERGAETAFVIELVYGGLFQVVGVPESELERVLLIECPRFLFPYARRVISDMTGEGGFPPFMLEPIDFAAVYAARQASGSDTVTIGNA
ncbi:preprotein translocase subunit SecB [Caulobacter ginsengisoli]|uniref:Protein-export protein SecB n=1 Tax=Caulobacter ginsengisoli TaxID=400775 RepID=A0ABU0ITC3_9CAUL|nr:protein-export chaperone SecB [Caulobacter ginsengisoli]MDQ0465258.1 preprotein translocase subunit SecB [Caulobacter ginsengisoli]